MLQSRNPRLGEKFYNNHLIFFSKVLVIATGGWMGRYNDCVRIAMGKWIFKQLIDQS